MSSEVTSQEALRRLFPEGSIDTTRIVQRCVKNRIYPIGATRIVVLESLDKPSNLIVWMGIEWADDEGIIHPDRTVDGVEYVKSDLESRIGFAGRPTEVELADQRVLRQMGLTVGKISPLDFIDRPLSGHTNGLFIASEEVFKLVADGNSARPDLDVIIPVGSTGVVTVKVEELVFGMLTRLNANEWTLVV